MIRLLYLAPVIGVIGAILVIYMIFVKPVMKNDKGKKVSATVALEEIKNDLRQVKQQQDILAASLEAQRRDIIHQSANASKLYQQTNSDDYKDLDLVKMKESINNFNQEALELAGNEAAIIQFNDQLRQGIAGLDRQIKEINFTDLLGSRNSVSDRLVSLKIQVSKLIELQKQIIEKSKQYNDRAREAVADMKGKLTEQGKKIADLKNDHTAVLEAKIEDTLNSQEVMLLKIKEQENDLLNLRQQNLEQIEISKARIAGIVEQMRDRLGDSREKIESNKEKMIDAREKMADAKQKAEDSKQRTQDLKEALRDRMHK